MIIWFSNENIDPKNDIKNNPIRAKSFNDEMENREDVRGAVKPSQRE